MRGAKSGEKGVGQLSGMKGKKQISRENDLEERKDKSIYYE